MTSSHLFPPSLLLHPTCSLGLHLWNGGDGRQSQFGLGQFWNVFAEGTSGRGVLASLQEESWGSGNPICLLPAVPEDSEQGLKTSSDRVSFPLGGHPQDTWGLSSWLLFALEEIDLQACVPSLKESPVLEVLFPQEALSLLHLGPCHRASSGLISGMPCF